MEGNEVKLGAVVNAEPGFQELVRPAENIVWLLV
jgi:hypothetical protein